jgi:O-antigen/teichoic acid export membrane protein
MSLRKRIIINAGSNWASMLAAAVVGLVLVRIILRDLEAAGYGVWALLATGLRYPMILERAFVLAINRFVAFYRSDIKELNRFVSASFIILTALAILTVATLTLLSFVISDIFSAITPEFERDARIACMLVGITLAFKMLEASFSGTLQGCQYYTRYNGVVITANLLRAVLTVGLLLFWKSIIAVQLAFGITAAVSALLMFIVARRSIAGLRVNVSLINKETLRELWRYTSHSIARSGSSIFMYSTMALLVGWAGTAANVAVFDIASRIPSFVRGFLAATQVVFLPAVSELWAKGRIEAIKAVIKKGTRISSVLACALLLLLFVFTEKILALWLKGAVPEGTVWVMRVLIISVLPGGLFEIWLPALVGIGHLRGLTIASIATALIAILLELILLRGFVIVPMAPAIALVVVLWAKTGIWLPFYGLNKLGIRPYEYLKESLYQPLAASVVSIAIIWVLNSVLLKGAFHWAVMLVLATVVVTASFTVISLRKETVDLIVTVRNRFRSEQEYKI